MVPTLHIHLRQLSDNDILPPYARQLSDERFCWLQTSCEHHSVTLDVYGTGTVPPLLELKAWDTVPILDREDFCGCGVVDSTKYKQSVGIDHLSAVSISPVDEVLLGVPATFSEDAAELNGTSDRSA